MRPTFVPSLAGAASAARLLPLLLGLLVPAAPAGAVTYRVHPDSALALGPPYYATVLEANAVATAGDSIEVSNAGSPYIHPTTMFLVSGVVYRGGFGPEFEGPNTVTYETVIELQPDVGVTDSVIETGAADAATVLAGFTITGGLSSFSGGGIFCDAGSALTIRNCRVLRNFAQIVGGGIHIGNGSAAKIFNCDVEENVAGARGGGISIALGAGAATVEFCRVRACSAGTVTADGGGGFFIAAPVPVTRCEIRDCWSGLNGGGMLVRSASPYLASNQFENCVAERSGGAAYHEQGAGQHRRSSFVGCIARTNNGGGISFLGGTWTVNECFVRDCSAAVRGGGVYFNGPVGASISLTEVLRNTAVEGGGIGIVGAPFRTALSVEVSACTVALNSATGPNVPAAGIQIFPEGNYADQIVNCIIADQVVGSGIACEGALNQPNIRYCCVWNDDDRNLDAEYSRGCADRTGIQGNLKVDPRFCDPTGPHPQVSVDNFSFTRGAGEGGVDMGAHPGSADCTIVSMERTTWGQIKSLYR